ncbi:hypothetical protein A2962_02765 [Candidatus Woesebacteria bacterium RIFCSPLOWO2_01_FULL_39_61]|uniref:Uncharacterized protein n=1 Tax=Candidatus Woesebacteria bacterium RIFCSPHIGHO2_02_FULL_39_13 TaxID=1802505 RepID=A0A1F7Z1Z4_9BACT|nr:MAG: hypothetical protein A2692_04965 [Candidatus Woesebacteria bacterium RIFCSPHIGHO2_01_FULL_39_95]OGM33547.1 MAG: hypothetical protein A3D01_01165 [Candidatus Woesebacteria bacterium RIFCSPHIGHO2_02_FULL_39_13]OGM38625.1 MAG: hypothetical protein A3E13_04585 [Candidatus Woesebacteria bacterium RIFCSPHIGHO2_12_FULL_40_20]OGM67316.1 MAG: hypothetical protein A2962_02765 [Candidatus Woesebacteria bacterium RIFCSPLOWO2_01_FULL_39_61]OGM74206.1 MAG: hypothetical protein A3H19_06015 [Candidatus
MDNSFKSVLDKSKSVLVLLPTKPYFDQVASGLALYLALREDKQVSIACPTPMTVEFNRLIGVNKISQELGDKNLIIRFVDYKASDIERVSYDIENGQFRLTVIPKQNINPPTKDQLDLSYSGISAGTVIIVGGTSESHFPAISSKDLVGADLVHVGTKDISLSSNKSFVSFSRPASSVSEVLYSLIKESGLKIDEDIATNLLVGIEEGSNKFSEGTVTADTFAAVGELMRMGGKRNPQPENLQKRDFPPGSIPGTFPANPQPQVSQQQAAHQQKLPEKSKDRQDEQQAPKDWLEPKIYKGTSIS